MTASSHAVSAPALPLLLSTDADFSLLVTAEGLLLSASATVWERLGWDPASCARHGVWAAVVEGGQRAAVRHLLADAVAAGTARTTLWLPSARGPLWVDAAATLVQGRNKDTRPAVLVTARDVTHDLAASSQIAASEHQWRMAFEHSPIGGVLLDAEGGVLVVNGAMCRMTGWREHELTRMDVTDVVVCEGGRPWREWWQELTHGGPGVTAEADRTVRTAAGHTFWGRLSAASLASSTSSARVVMQVEDITSRREAELELADRALNDALTGAPNRFFTRQWLASALEDHPGAGVGVVLERTG